jgi:hypothetical protein
MIIVKGKMMQIKNVKPVGKRKVYDISVKDAEHYILENGVVTHNTGSYYAADNIYILGRQQEKEGTEVIGYNFIINVEKSRYTKEKSKIPVCVSFKGGISKWSGLIDLALESGIVIKPSNGWYQKVNLATGELLEKKYRLKETESAEFWDPILESTQFKAFIESKYKVSHGDIFGNDIDEDIDAVFADEELEDA